MPLNPALNEVEGAVAARCVAAATDPFEVDPCLPRLARPRSFLNPHPPEKFPKVVKKGIDTFSAFQLQPGRQLDFSEHNPEQPQTCRQTLRTRGLHCPRDHGNSPRRRNPRATA